MIIEQPARLFQKYARRIVHDYIHSGDSKIKVFFVCSKLEERNQETSIECSPCSQGLKKEVKTRAEVTTT